MTLTTRKPAEAVTRGGGHDAVQARARLDAGEVVSLFEGTVREVVTRFPTTTNVAATLAIATLGFDRVRVQLLADPKATHVLHHVEAEGPIGRYQVEVTNRPSDNPRTSAVTAYAVLRGLLDEVATFRLL